MARNAQVVAAGVLVDDVLVDGVDLHPGALTVREGLRPLSFSEETGKG
jgi:hypothetical protein